MIEKEDPKKIAEMLINDFIQLHPPTDLLELKTQYELCKCSAEYTAIIIKSTHVQNSEKYKLFENVITEINKL